MSTNIRTNSIHQLLPLNYKANQKPQAIKPNIKYTTHHIKKDKEKKIGPTILGFILRKQWHQMDKHLVWRVFLPGIACDTYSCLLLIPVMESWNIWTRCITKACVLKAATYSRLSAVLIVIGPKDMSPKLLLWLVNVYILKAAAFSKLSAILLLPNLLWCFWPS